MSKVCLFGNNTKAFFALLRAGLWEEVNLFDYGEIDFKILYDMSEEQTVLGVVTAGLNHVTGTTIPKQELLQFIGSTMQIEERNKAMNSFIADLVEGMRKSGIYTLLVKGQGIAQCYERPLWRNSGDIDLFLSEGNYEQAKRYLLALSDDNKIERQYSKEQGISIGPWYVEVHGTQRTGLSQRVDLTIDSVQKDIFYGGNVRSWTNGRTQVFLPAPSNDVFFVFTHFLKHFYKGEGASIRQLCDCCRLIWTYKDVLNYVQLEKWLRRAGLMPEWRLFAAIAVDFMGMPAECMPLYDKRNKWSKKAGKAIELILSERRGGRLHAFLSVIRILPFKTLCYFSSILFEVNYLKIKEKYLVP